MYQNQGLFTIPQMTVAIIGGLFRRFDFVNSYLAFVLRYCLPQSLTHSIPDVLVKTKFLSQLFVVKGFAIGVKRRLFPERAYFQYRPKTLPKRLRIRHCFQKTKITVPILTNIGNPVNRH
jgi:hypothetical protein